MRIAVLAAPESWYLRDLRRAAGSDHDIVACGFSQLATSLSLSREATVFAGETDLTTVDAVLVRSMPPGSLEQVVFRMDALARAERSGTLVVNPPRALEVAIDKYLTLARLSDAGLTVPPTITCQTSDAAMTAFDSLGGDVVVKPLFGSEGRGIARLTDPALAIRAFRLLEQLGAVIYLQAFVPHHGYDVRVFVLGDRVLSMRRLNSEDWRTNVSRGARTEPCRLEHGWEPMARTAAAAVGAPVAGVDLLPARDGRVYVLEVNAVPGWKALARTLQCDVARLVLDYLVDRHDLPGDS